jgi:hypothetical protein
MLNRKVLVNRLNHTNSKLKGLGLPSSDESHKNLFKTLLKVRRVICLFRFFFNVKID